MRKATPLFATPANMRAAAAPGVIAYSLRTGEECSASAGDYFMMRDDEPICDRKGKPMILVRRETRHIPLFAQVQS